MTDKPFDWILTDDEWFEIVKKHPTALGEGRALLSLRGSAAHGLWEDTGAGRWQTDDLDLIAVNVPPPELVLGLKDWAKRGTYEVQEGKWDVVTYEWRKLLRLLEKGNPNVLALLWQDHDTHLSMGPAGEVLINARELFSTQAAYPAFRGYAQGTLHKMQGAGAYEGYMGKRRKALVDEFGYDVKQASHLVRILRLGIEFMTTGRMTVDRREWGDDEELLAIKHGEWSKEKVEGCAKHLDWLLSTTLKTCTLPERADRKKVEQLSLDMVRAGWRAEGWGL